MTHLSVNLNAVAQLRNRRNLPWPSVTGMARVVLDAGASGITIHPRPDERHIRRTDVFELEALLRADYPTAEYNVEGYPSEDFLALVEQVAPDQVTFVPDDPTQNTSDHGWDIGASRVILDPAIARMKKAGIRISLFIDEDPEMPAAAREVGADRVELYTGPYGGSYGTPEGDQHLMLLATTAGAAHAVGLLVNAGHDLTLENLPVFMQVMPTIAEVSIGHGITADALLMGFPEAVQRYRAVLGGRLLGIASAKGPDKGANRVAGRGAQFIFRRRLAHEDGVGQVSIDQCHELAGRKIGVWNIQLAIAGDARKAGGDGRPVLAGAIFLPGGEQFGVALAFVLDQLAQGGAVFVAHALAGQAHGELGQLSFQILGLVRESADDLKQAGAGASGDILNHGDEKFFLVADLVVDGLAGHAGAGGDVVDAGAGDALLAEHLRRSLEDSVPLDAMAAHERMGGGFESRCHCPPYIGA